MDSTQNNRIYVNSTASEYCFFFACDLFQLHLQLKFLSPQLTFEMCGSISMFISGQMGLERLSRIDLSLRHSQFVCIVSFDHSSIAAVCPRS